MGEPPADRYKCDSCRAQKRQEDRGCKKESDRVVWKINECCLCGGKNEKCQLCEGRNEVIMRRCPHALLDDNIQFVLPFFYSYRKSEGTAWPDGRGRLFQPIKLVMAFDVLNERWSMHRD